MATACNDAFRWVWGVDDAAPFGAGDRRFLDERARATHGDRFEPNIEPVIAMLQSSIGHYPDAAPLRELRDRIVADPRLRRIWNAREITSPLLTSTCTITSPAGLFTYETLTLLVSNTMALVVQVPDEMSRRQLLKRAIRNETSHGRP